MTNQADDGDGRAADATLAIQDTLRSAVAYNAWIHALLAPYLGCRVFDAGCGIGNLTRLLLPDAEVVIAYERRQDFCDIVRSELGTHAQLRVVQGDLATLDVTAFAAERIDTVVCVNVLEHIEDDVALLERFRDMLIAGGRVLLFVPAHPWLYGAHDAADGHFRRYTKRALRSAMLSAGLDVERLRWVNLPGIFGWWLNRRRRCVGLDDSQCRVFDRLVPIIAAVERWVPPPVGLSLLAVGRKES